MKFEDEKVEPVTDLGLSLDYCSQYDQGRSNDDPSAGANAGSSLRMAFVSANPLSELVWSPQRGLSLKCADCSFTGRKPSLPWGVGTSTPLDSLPETDIAAPTCSIVPLDELNTTSPKEMVNANSGTNGEITAGKFSIRDTCFIPAPESSKEERAGNGDGFDDMIYKKLPTEVSLKNKSIEREDGGSIERQKYSITSKAEENSLPDSPGQVGANSINSHISILFCGDPSMEEKEVDPNNREIGMEIVPASEAKTLNEHEDSDSPVSFQGKAKSKRTASDISALPCLDKLEAAEENDLQLFNKERTYDVAATVVAPESVPAGKTNSLEEREVKEAVGVMDSTGDCTFLKHHSKGKGKALSDGGVSGLPSKADDDSYESVESCNSVGRFSSGKRRWSYEQEFFVGNKRAKQSEDIPESSSVVNHDSSFMKWISSMTKGFAKSNQDDEDLLALALSNPDPSRKESMGHSLPMDRKTQPHGNSNMGFKSIFQSIYCPNKTAARTSLCSNLVGETPREIDTIRKSENSVELEAPKENLYESESPNVVGPLTLPQISFGNFVVSLENRFSGPAENNNSGMVEGDQAKVTVQSSHESLPIMLKTNIENDIPLAEEKKTNDVDYKGGALGSSWISRFSSRPAVSLLKQDSLGFHRDQVTVEVKKSSSQESPNVADNELKDCVVSNEASTGFRQSDNLHDKTLFNSMHEILPSQRVENSEAMASIFARRLDALKNIIPSPLMIDDGTARPDTTCFFCGIKGHHLQNCPEISEAELENLLKNVKSSDNAGASPRLCIRCFQLNHWASACPGAPHKEKAEASVQENIPRDRFNCSIEFEEVSIGQHNMIANLEVKRYNIRSHVGNHVSERLKTSSEKDLRLQIADVPKGILAAVKMLRLSRVDILKWMNSKISLSHLDGFFLRLRLGKWEEGLGGTGYYVACISGMQKEGMQKEGSLKNTKRPISVSIGGMKCLVETQYISNQDFLEDELMAWWCTTSRGGGKIMSEEDLKRKAEEKKRLGF